MPSKVGGWICIDASVIVRLVRHTPSETVDLDLWQRWENAGNQLAAPALLHYELTNAFHRYALAGEMSAAEAREALEAALDLDITLFGDPHLHQRALAIAQLTGLRAAYDAHYLALAERLDTELWTADRRLYQAVREMYPWVHWIE